MVSRRLQACFQQVSKHSVHLFWSFDCFAALRAHSRAGAPTGPSAASLRARAWAGAPGWSLGCSAALRASVSSPLDCSAPLRSALAPGLAPPAGPSAAPLRCAPPCLPRSTAPLRCAPRSRLGWRPRLVPRLLRCAARLVSSPLDCSALRARAWAGAPTGPSTAPLRSAPRVFPRSTLPLRSRLGAPSRLVSSRSTAPLRSAPRVFPARLLRFAPRSRLGWRPRLILRLLRCAPRSRPGLAPPTAPSSAPLRFARAWLSTLACEISQAAGLCYAGVRSGARYVVHTPSIPDLSAKELASA